MHKHREIAIGDIHGISPHFVKRLIEDEIQFDPLCDTLIFLGDYIDRGNHSLPVIEYMSCLKQVCPSNIILLKGNHECFAEDALNIQDCLDEWLSIGGDKTIASFGSTSLNLLETFIASLSTYYETDNALYCHGGLPSNNPVGYFDEKELLFNREFEYIGSKPVVVGHTVVDSPSWLGATMRIDTGAVFGRGLTAYDIVNDRLYQVNTNNETEVSINEYMFHVLCEGKPVVLIYFI